MRKLMLMLTVAAAAFLAACGDNGGSVGPEDLQYRMGIISGKYQISRAGAPRLDSAVVGRLVSVKLADGSSRIRLVSPLYAQTVVNGSPVPGAVVCAEDPIDANGVVVIPEVKCTNTDSQGQAVFWYRPGNRSGVARSLIKGTVDGQVEVFDSVEVVITPGELHTAHLVDPPPVAPGDTIKLRNVILSAHDRYGNEIDVHSLPDSLIGWAWYNPSAGDGTDPQAPTHYGWVAVVPDSAGLEPYREELRTEHGTRIAINLGIMVWIDGAHSGGRLITVVE